MICCGNLWIPSWTTCSWHCCFLSHPQSTFICCTWQSLQHTKCRMQHFNFCPLNQSLHLTLGSVPTMPFQHTNKSKWHGMLVLREVCFQSANAIMVLGLWLVRPTGLLHRSPPCTNTSCVDIRREHLFLLHFTMVLATNDCPQLVFEEIYNWKDDHFYLFEWPLQVESYVNDSAEFWMDKTFLIA